MKNYRNASWFPQELLDYRSDFNLYAIAQKCLNKKGQKLYVAFVDFKKAFDSVHHDKLLQAMQKGVQGKFFASIKSMYYSLLSCVRANSEYSDFFDCPVGVRQGCVLSPTIFSVFINQLTNYITETGRKVDMVYNSCRDSLNCSYSFLQMM